MSNPQRVELRHGDCIELMRALPDNSIDSIVTDPPYGLGFMGKEWDDLPPSKEWADQCLRVLKPGGHLLAFGGTRTYHRLAVAIEDAGFEIRDSMMWLYGSGFPKSHDVSKAIDKASGAQREVVGKRSGPMNNSEHSQATSFVKGAVGYRPDFDITAPATPAAQQWQGWGTALKPAHEPIVVARKPLIGTVAENVLEWGVGAINIDGCRIKMSDENRKVVDLRSGAGFGTGDTVGLNQGRAEGKFSSAPAGRWPANVILDESQAAELDKQSGVSGGGIRRDNVARIRNNGLELGTQDTRQGPANSPDNYDDTGGASRFFYVAKANKRERPKVDDVAHPTVKPLALMRWLVRLVTPPGGVVLDPFAGSGTTVEAALLEGFSVLAFEKTADYLPLISERIRRTDTGANT